MSLNFNNSNIFFNLSNNSYNGSLAVNSSNDLVILNDSNLGSIAVSNIKIGQSNNFIILQKQAGSNVIQMITSTGTVLGISSEAIFGSNAAFFASNTISESGTIFASNASVVGSNTGIFGSNLVVRLSNALYSNVNTFQNLIVVQNQVNSNTLSNLGNALFSSNVTITGSNTVGYINAGSEWLYNPTLGTYSSKRVLTLNAEVGNTVFPTVTSGTLQLRLDALTLPNGNVTTWTDQSTNALAFTSCNTPPVRVNSAINGMPGVLFQGTGFVKNDSYTTSFNSNNTLFYVVSNITGGLLMYKGSSALVWNTGIKMIWMGDSTISYSGQGLFPSFVGYSGGYYRATSAIPATGSTVICMSRTSATTMNIFYNGVAITGLSGTDAGAELLRLVNDAGNTLAFGLNSTSPLMSSINGYVHEILHYNAALSSTDITAINTYLMTKWNGADIGTGVMMKFMHAPDNRWATIQSVIEASAASKIGLNFYTSSTILTPPIENMRITGDGNVGIGTSNPSTMLHVIGAALINSGTLSNADVCPVTLASVYNAANIGYGLQLKFNHNSNNNTHAYIRSVAEETLANTIGLAFHTSPHADSNLVKPEVMRLAGNGNVGIGITAPTEKLHVSGNILATGTFAGSGFSNTSPSNLPCSYIASSKLDSSNYSYFELSAGPQSNAYARYGIITATKFTSNLADTSSTYMQIIPGGLVIGPQYTGGNTSGATTGDNVNTQYTWGSNQFADGNSKRVGIYGSIAVVNSVYSAGVALTSDDRIKSDEAFITDATNTINKLRPQTYKKWTSMDYLNDSNDTFVKESGLIAQEIFYDAPELRDLIVLPSDIDSNIVYDSNYKITSSIDPSIDPAYPGWGSNIASVNYIGFIPYLIKALQEKDVEILELKTNFETRLATLENI